MESHGPVEARPARVGARKSRLAEARARLTSSVAPFVIILLVAIVTIMSLVGGAFYWAKRVQQKERALADKVSIVADQAAAALSLPMWNYDENQVEKILESLMRDREVFAIAARQEGDSPSARVRGRDDSGRVIALDVLPDAGRLPIASRPVMYQERRIGSVLAQVTRIYAAAELRMELYRFLGLVLGQNAVVVLGLYLILWTVILSPLRRIERWASAVSSAGGSPAERTIDEGRRFRGELVGLRAAIETMVGLLVARLEELRASELKYRSLFEYTPVAIWEEDFSSLREKLVSIASDAGGDLGSYLARRPDLVKELAAEVKVLDVNRACLDMLGYEDRDELLAGIAEHFTDRAYEVFGEELAALWAGARSFNGETIYIRKDGEWLDATVRVAILSGYEESWGKVLISTVDTTTLKLAEENLRYSIREKDALLRELYHRTKNNMQVICAMLNLRSSYTEDERIKSAFKELQSRILTMSLAQDMLYESNDLSRIDLGVYLRDLTRSFAETFDDGTGRIGLGFEVESFRVPIEAAMPCGLLLIELLSNSMLHAFPEGRRGRIEVGLQRIEGGVVALSFSDDGIGVPEDFDFRSRARLGLSTVFSIGEGQLAGRVEIGPLIRPRGGLSCLLTFSDSYFSAKR
jgi:two-component sensor histidine kinase/PAS domain-containing protein